MREPELKVAVYRKLIHKHLVNGSATAFEELILGPYPARIDYVVVNKVLHGIELKSAGDSLRRLDRQQQIYSPFFEQITLVADVRHCELASAMIPDWWGIVEADWSRRGTVKLTTIRSGGKNPLSSAAAMITLLWPFEMVRELDEIGAARGWRDKPAYRLWEHMLNTFDEEEIKALVKRRMKARQHSSIAPQYM